MSGNSGHDNEVFVVAVGETSHSIRRDDVSTTELAWEAVSAAIEDAGIALADVGGAVTASLDFWEGRTISSMAINEVVGATFKPESKVSGDGTLALAYAKARISTGQHRLLIVLAHCKESHADAHTVERAAFDPVIQWDLDPDEVVAAALQAQLLGYPDELRGRVVAATRARSSWLDPVDANALALSAATATPLHELDRAPYMDGAVALVVCDEETASGIGKPRVRIAGAGTSTAAFWTDRDLTKAPELRRALDAALDAAGWDGAPDDFEVTAPYAHQLLLFGVELGLGSPDDVASAVESGAFASGGSSLAGRPSVVAGLSNVASCVRRLQASGGRAVAHGVTGLLAQSHHIVCLEAK